MSHFFANMNLISDQASRDEFLRLSIMRLKTVSWLSDLLSHHQLWAIPIGFLADRLEQGLGRHNVDLWWSRGRGALFDLVVEVRKGYFCVTQQSTLWPSLGLNISRPPSLLAWEMQSSNSSTWRFWDLTDAILAYKDENSKLIDAVSVANVDAEIFVESTAQHCWQQFGRDFETEVW